MREGLPLIKHRDVRGNMTYIVSPRIPSKYHPDHFNQFWGRVTANYSEEKLIQLWVSPIRSPFKGLTEPSYTALIHYTTFSRVNIVDEFSTEGAHTNNTPLSGSNPQPFKSARNVILR